ncbi:hypothetical protein GOP47_0002547 [Adiantum capillus-veneris]|uniref:peptidylprolyl isomerase n=1 Tax=Adiantum capillus-veneris TaxID=13818 RepID=A0A9D4VB40_ADICA|nr:hypothetical protein GOP47_0002547 [Adiantum capillus-veneris]
MVAGLSAASSVSPSTWTYGKQLLADSAKVLIHHHVRSCAWMTSPYCTMSSRSSNFEDQKLTGKICVLETRESGVLRREMLSLPITLIALAFDTAQDERVLASEFVDMPALRGKDYGKPKMKYRDYTMTESGLQFKDLRPGSGQTPKEGETVVVDWDGYTIGYYGRIFEARNKAKGGSFEGNDKDYLRIRLGTHEVIPAFEEAISTMSLGGVRRIIVPPELGYPDNDFNKKGPKPTTFSGQRALAFVLQNQNLIDKTLLFDIELLKISST